MQGIGDSIVKLRNRFSILARNDASLSFRQIVEVLIEYGDGGWTGMIKTSLAIELANTSVDVDLQVFSCGREGL